MRGKALVIGNSDGIGLATTKELLKQGWKVVGVSRSESPIQDPPYEHILAEVQDAGYSAKLKSVLENHGPIDVCIFCAGIGKMLDLSNMEDEVRILEVNLLGMVKTASCVIPLMVKRGKGHFIGISSVADELVSAEAPSYHASKAGFSNYLEGLALAAKPRGVHVSNIRFGFVDTKMAKGDVKPFMMGVERATRHLLSCIEKKPVRYTAPLFVIPLVKFRSLMLRLSVIL
ncbi:MAG: SDR family NAD(P)-dependent oxidoreductase [Deltaproteobacteria bacterium]|nr:MAG: SDR family NAD(P)-dependent oxidoreductase [Deltaproteobacteria bacterium]UCH06432.1 MAG: SDR family NAD(P)-dependent oxidoreductase [Deltaproteobacteria bacterium]